MEQILINAGLTILQAQTYLYLLEHGPTMHKVLTNNLKISRTNAYKVLGSLEDLELVNKTEVNKKLAFSPSDPTMLSSLVAEKRNTLIAMEQNIDKAIQQLRKVYSKQTKDTLVTTVTSKQAMLRAYEEQSELRQPIYFYKSRTDIPFMGFETMDRIRRIQGRRALIRFGITPDSPEAALNEKIDDSANLKRTWIDDKSYTAPVEWSVSGDQLLIQLFDDRGIAIVIRNNLIADAFKQIWKLTDRALKNSPDYKLKPLKAKRIV